MIVVVQLVCESAQSVCRTMAVCHEFHNGGLCSSPAFVWTVLLCSSPAFVWTVLLCSSPTFVWTKLLCSSSAFVWTVLLWQTLVSKLHTKAVYISEQFCSVPSLVFSVRYWKMGSYAELCAVYDARESRRVFGTYNQCRSCDACSAGVL